MRNWRYLLFSTLVGLAGCGGGQDKRLNAGGSTFVYPIMSKWAAEYEKVRGVQVNYQAVGSGGGIQQMTVKTFDFGCTDSPLNEEQLAKCRQTGGDVVHIPLVMGAVVPIYNLDEVKQPLCFSGPVLADIYLGKIRKWNDPALKELNPQVDLPGKDIAVIHRADGSGTTFIWLDYLSKVSAEWTSRVGVATSVNWPTGVGQKGNAGVAGQVRRSPGSIGYVELIYALQNQITYGLVKNRAGQPVLANLDSVKAAADNSLADIPDDLRYTITDAPGKNSYPIAGTVWVVVYTKLPGDKGPAIVDFLRWITHEGQQYAEGLHYARLPSGLVERLDKKLTLIQTGK